jgi:hypothetical protein
MSILILSCCLCLSLPSGLSNFSVCTTTVYTVVLLLCTFPLYAQNEAAKQLTASDHMHTPICAFWVDHNMQLVIPTN